MSRSRRLKTNSGKDKLVWGPTFALDLPKYSQSMERGLAILQCFTPERPVLGIADIADELGMSRSTTHRYVTTLVALGYMEQGTKRRYRLGLRVTDLGASVMNATGLREHAHTLLEGLSRSSGCATSIAVLDGMEVVIVDRLRSYRAGAERTNVDLRQGSRLPAYCTATGKVLLAYLPADELRRRLKETALIKHGPNTILSKRKMMQELNTVFDDGLAVSDEECQQGLISISAPVLESSAEVIAAIDMSAPASAISVSGLVSELSPHLIAIADLISARLGFRREGGG